MATFLEYYEREIMSRLTMADLILKTGQEPYDLTQMLSCLQLSKEQAESLLETALVRGITRSQFLVLLHKGDSDICRMFQRELRCGLPAVYTPAQISYIYDLDLEQVEQAAEQTGLNPCQGKSLSRLFSAIDLSRTQYWF